MSPEQKEMEEVIKHCAGVIYLGECDLLLPAFIENIHKCNVYFLILVAGMDTVSFFTHIQKR
jgi:hypothetical protein